MFSHGFLCPKGTALEAARRRPRPPAPAAGPRDGRHVARGVVGRGVRRDRRAALADPRAARPRRRRACTSATRTRTTSPSSLYNRVLHPGARHDERVLARAPSTRCRSRSSAGLMFGAALSVPVPDVDRTDYLVILGANPFASNGSLMTAPDFPGRLEALQARGGSSSWSTRAARRRPRRPTSTCSSGPAPTRTSSSRSCTRCSPRTSSTSGDVDGPRGRRSTRCERLARDVRARGGRAGLRHRRRHDPPHRARARRRRPRPRCTARIGTCTQEFGTLASWLVDVVNVLTGNLDRAGRRRCSRSRPRRREHAAVPPAPGAGVRFGRRQSRVRGLPEFVRRVARRRASPRRSRPRATARSAAMITVAGNPVLSTPDAAASTAALASLDFMVSVDIYRNETTRHADVILPPPSAFCERPLRPRAVLARDPQRRELLAAGRRPRAGRAGRVGDPAAPRRRRGRAGRRRPTPAVARRLRRRRRSCRRRCSEPGSQRRRPRRRRAARRARAAAAGRSASSTSCCAPAPTATASAPTRRACRSRCSRRTRTASTSVRCSRASPRCCARRAG